MFFFKTRRFELGTLSFDLSAFTNCPTVPSSNTKLKVQSQVHADTLNSIADGFQRMRQLRALVCCIAGTDVWSLDDLPARD
jgi:hypothetical protein